MESGKSQASRLFASKDHSLLFWKVLVRQPEIVSGELSANREMTIRMVQNHPEVFFSRDRSAFVANVKSLLKNSRNLNPETLESFTLRVFESLSKEFDYLNNRSGRFSIDILFQVIEILCLQNNPEEAGAKMNLRLPDFGLEVMLPYIKAYVQISSKLSALNTIKNASAQIEEIIFEVSVKFPDIQILALESMVRIFIAQLVLSEKYHCDNLLNAWMNEYGFSDSEMQRILKYIPLTTPIKDFRVQYVQGIKSSKVSNDSNSDVMLLRTLSNYFTSWVMRTSELIPSYV
ncbi:MAG: hypothetical protein K8R21_12415 [Leptospira sp.]|nr:hypothetical protein [Leptospira sp.]